MKMNSNPILIPSFVLPWETNQLLIILATYKFANRDVEKTFRNVDSIENAFLEFNSVPLNHIESIYIKINFNSNLFNLAK